MTKFLVDSGILSAYIDRRLGIYEQARLRTTAGNRVGTCVPVVAEMVAGLERSQSRDRNLKALRAALPSLKVWPFDYDTAFEYGRLHAELVRLGRPMQTIDIMIAAIARKLGNCTVVTADSDLSAVPGLSVENWAAYPPTVP